MERHKFTKLFLLLALSLAREVSTLRCDRRPYGSTTQASSPDGRYKLTVLGTDNTYLPDQVYTVQLAQTDGESQFTAFVISAEGDFKQDPRNPRRLVAQHPGDIRPMETGKYSDRCLYSVEQSSFYPKSSVEVYWQAPPTGSGCVTLRAMVAESQEVWFEDGAPLTHKLCEDMRQPDDVSPNLNYDCKICDEAKYEITFTGSWSRNIHPRLFPENDWLPRYSDLVGASHSVDYVLWAPGKLASEGLRELAERANTTKFEAEIRENIGEGVRTLIKGKGHGYKKMGNPTHAFFRTDKDHHLITAAVALYPSPDWFLGVNRFELCQEDNTWLKERELKLFPWDAGTDSGLSYESVNIETFPQDAVGRVEMSSYDKNSPFFETDLKDLHPFGTLHIKLIRTYSRECEESTEEEKEAEGEEVARSPEPDEPSRYQNPDIPSDGHDRTTEAPLEVDPEASDEECPITQWQEWSECDGLCENGMVIGHRWRERYHLVDGVAVEKYDPDVDHEAYEQCLSHRWQVWSDCETAKQVNRKPVPPYCKSIHETFQQKPCEEPCSEKEENTVITADRRTNHISPGHPWGSRKRELFTDKNRIRGL